MNNITKRAARVLREIDAALEMAEKATPGPWIQNDTHESVCIPGGGEHCYPLRWNNGQGPHDAAFIAASRTGWPAALRMSKKAIEWGIAMGEHGEPLVAIICDQFQKDRIAVDNQNA